MVHATGLAGGAADPLAHLVAGSGMGSGRGSPNVGLVHSPMRETLTPAFCAEHELPYVLSSHPHTGE